MNSVRPLFRAPLGARLVVFALLVQGFAAAPVLADDFAYFEQKAPVEQPPDNPGWVCAVTDLHQEHPQEVRVAVQSQGDHHEGRVLLSHGSSFVIRVGRPASGSAPGSDSAQFLTYGVVSGSGAPVSGASGFLSADDMSACSDVAGDVAPLRYTAGLQVRCTPDTGYSNYFGVTSPDCENGNAAKAIGEREAQLSRAVLILGNDPGFAVGVSDPSLVADSVVAYGRDTNAYADRLKFDGKGVDEVGVLATGPSGGGAGSRAQQSR
jgi:hypothetical protein